MSDVTTIGIDLAKHRFSLHGVDRTGRDVLHRTVQREQLLSVEVNQASAALLFLATTCAKTPCSAVCGRPG